MRFALPIRVIDLQAAYLLNQMWCQTAVDGHNSLMQDTKGYMAKVLGNWPACRLQNQAVMRTSNSQEQPPQGLGSEVWRDVGVLLLTLRSSAFCGSSGTDSSWKSSA